MFHFSRRHFLNNAGFGFAGLALADLLKNDTTAASPGPKKIDPLSPLIERASDFMPKAERVIFLFQSGGPSTFDLMDYKPALQAFYCDNQGPWNGTSTLKHLTPGSFQGHPGGFRWYDLEATKKALGPKLQAQ